MSRHPAVLGLLSAALGAAVLLAPSRLGAQSAADTTGLEPVIVELAVGRYGTETVMAYRSSGEALLPVLRLAEMAEIRARPLAGGAIELTLDPGRKVVLLEPARWEIRTGDGAIELTPADRAGEAGRPVSQHSRFSPSCCTPRSPSTGASWP